jgi:hypothetical protein
MSHFTSSFYSEYHPVRYFPADLQPFVAQNLFCSPLLLSAFQQHTEFGGIRFPLPLTEASALLRAPLAHQSCQTPSLHHATPLLPIINLYINSHGQSHIESLRKTLRRQKLVTVSGRNLLQSHPVCWLLHAIR